MKIPPEEIQTVLALLDEIGQYFNVAMRHENFRVDPRQYNGEIGDLVMGVDKIMTKYQTDNYHIFNENKMKALNLMRSSDPEQVAIGLKNIRWWADEHVGRRLRSRLQTQN